MEDKKYNSSELISVLAADEMQNGDNVLTGVGLPNIAANLAKKTGAPNLQIIYESGAIDASPPSLPLSIGDPSVAENTSSLVTVYEVFSYYLQGGNIDVGFVGGAQIDKYGNINSTVIGDYEDPKVRLPGSGGACPIVSLSEKTIILTNHNKRRFPEQVDFITSPGFIDGRETREKLGLKGGGPETVITNLGRMEFDEEGEMYLSAIHPGVEVEQVQENTGWDLKVADDLKTTREPSDKELKLLREDLDPNRRYI